jgi:hypothetical protein
VQYTSWCRHAHEQRQQLGLNQFAADAAVVGIALRQVLHGKKWLSKFRSTLPSIRQGTTSMAFQGKRAAVLPGWCAKIAIDAWRADRAIWTDNRKKPL